MSVTTWVGFVGAALVIMAYLPQVVHLIKERCSWGISLGAYAMWFVAGILICAHAVSLNDPVFIVLQGYNVVATATIAAFAKKYKQNICIDHRQLAAAAESQPHRRSAGSDGSVDDGPTHSRVATYHRGAKRGGRSSRILGRACTLEMSGRVATIMTPDTILRRHRRRRPD